MKKSKLINLYFDKGNGAIFKVEVNGQLIKCFVVQDNKFLVKKSSPGQNFPDVFERYASVIYKAAIENINSNGIDPNPWGNQITAKDIENVQRK